MTKLSDMREPPNHSTWNAYKRVKTLERQSKTHSVLSVVFEWKYLLFIEELRHATGISKSEKCVCVCELKKRVKCFTGKHKQPHKEK